MSEKTIVLVGAGFAGLQVIHKLGNIKGINLIVIDKTNHHLFQPLLYQVASSVLSPADIAIPTRSLTTNYKNVQVILGEVQDINLEHSKVHLKNTTIQYDYLILALGAKTSYFGNEHWEKYAVGLKSLEDALKIRQKILLSFEKAEIQQNPEKARKMLKFVIVGGGPTGVEMAGAIAELAHHIIRKDFRFIDPALSEIYLIEAGPRLLPSFSEKSSLEAKKELEKRGVKVLLNTKVLNIDDKGVHTNNQTILTQNIIWAAGVRASSLTDKLNVEKDKAGRIVVDSFCSIPNYPNVFAIGDVACFIDEKTNKPLPGVSPVAMQQGRYVAKLIKDELRGTIRKEKFIYFDKGSMATIGRKDAVAEFAGLKISGFLGWLAWLFVHLFYQVGFKNKISILITWIWSYVTFKAGARLITNLEEET
ncbi:MAG: NAD(P)/FAD-dependent oxidoreductase [Leptospiraceae bacterium]|nr:NAD(P)/FAD-dependent oxidoreductase [Leptospiraceae bacterium]